MGITPSATINWGYHGYGSWDLYARYEPIINNSFLSVGIGIKGAKENPEIIQIEMIDRTKAAGRQVIRYDTQKKTKEIYWTYKKVYQDNGPDILAEVIEACPKFPEDIRKQFNIKLT